MFIYTSWRLGRWTGTGRFFFLRKNVVEAKKNMFGTYEDVSEGGMYVFDRYQDSVNTWDALTVSLKDGKIQHIILKWADKNEE